MEKNSIKNDDKSLTYISLVDIFIFFRKRLFLFAKLYLLALTLLVLFYLFITPAYKADATIQSIAKDNSALSALNPMAMILGGTATASITTDVELLSSRRVLNALIKETNLQFVVKKKRWVMATYFFDKLAGGNEPSGIFYVATYPKGFSKGDVVITKDGYILESSLGKIGCEWNRECDYGEGTLQLNILGTPRIGNDFSIKRSDFLETRRNLKQGVAFATIDGTKDMIKISYSSSNPYKSKFVVENIIKQFSSLKQKWDGNDAIKKQEYISKTLANLKKDIDDNAEKLIAFQKSTDTFMPDKRIEITITKLLDTVDQLDAAHLKAELLTNTISRVALSTETEPIIAKVLATDPSLQQMLITHNSLIFKLNQLTQKFTDEHPLVKEMKSQITASKKSVMTSLNAQKDSLKNITKTLSKKLNLIKKDQKKTPEKFFTFATLKRNLILSQKLYTALAGKMFETSFDQRGGMDPVRVIDAPTSLVLKASPRTSLFLIIATILSGILALGAIFVYEFFRNRLFDADEVKKYLPAQLYSLKKGDDSTALYQNLFNLFSITNGKSVLYTSFCSTPALTQEIFSQLPQLAGKKSCFISFDSEGGLLPQEIANDLPGGNELLIALGSKEIPLFLASSLFQKILKKMEQTYDTFLLHIKGDEIAIAKDDISYAFDFTTIETVVKQTRLTNLATFAGKASNNPSDSPIAALVLEEK